MRLRPFKWPQQPSSPPHSSYFHLLFHGESVGKVATLNAFSLSLSAPPLTKIIDKVVAVRCLCPQHYLLFMIIIISFRVFCSAVVVFCLSRGFDDAISFSQVNIFWSNRLIAVSTSLFPCLAFLFWYCVIACRSRSHPRLTYSILLSVLHQRERLRNIFLFSTIEKLHAKWSEMHGRCYLFKLNVLWPTYSTSFIFSLWL